jgi:hypothetical protein
MSGLREMVSGGGYGDWVRLGFGVFAGDQEHFCVGNASKLVTIVVAPSQCTNMLQCSVFTLLSRVVTR